MQGITGKRLTTGGHASERSFRWMSRKPLERNHATECGEVCSTLKAHEASVGEGNVKWSRNGHDAELEWCLLLHRPLSRMKVGHRMPCLLQGTLRQRSLKLPPRLIGEEPVEATDRNIIAIREEQAVGEFGGIETCLQDLMNGNTYARMELEYTKENLQGSVSRSLSIAFLTGISLVASIRQLQQRVLNGETSDSRMIRLLPPENCGGYLQERWLKYQSALNAVKGGGCSKMITNRVYEQIVRDVITRKEYIKCGTSARLKVFDGKGDCIGVSLLHVHS